MWVSLHVYVIHMNTIGCTCQGKLEEVIESQELELRRLGANFYLEIISTSWASGLLQEQQVLLTAELYFVLLLIKQYL